MRTCLIFLLLLVAAITGGCVATPVVVDNGTQSRILVPCVNDTLCVRATYEVARDVWCPTDCVSGDVRCRRDYPVSYRSKNWEYETNRVEYIYLPRTLVVQ
jgi:hypothetical protein